MEFQSRRKERRSLRRVTIGKGARNAVKLPPHGSLITTVDTMVEGVHFDLSYMSPRELGHKALAVALSDIAAIAGRPLFAQVSVGVRQDTSEPFLMEIQGGVESLARRFRIGTQMISTVQSPTALIVHTSILAAAGKVEVSDSGARAGDLIAVTGDVGTSAAGLNCLKRLGRHALASHDEILKAHLLPTPRIDEAQVLARTGGVTSILSLNDGLASELHLVAAESSVGALIDETRIPLSESTRRAGQLINSDPRAWALYGGEDFELLLTISPKKLSRMEAAMKRLDAKLTVIGEVLEKAQGVQLKLSTGECVALQPRLWNHLVRRRRVSSR